MWLSGLDLVVSKANWTSRWSLTSLGVGQGKNAEPCSEPWDSVFALPNSTKQKECSHLSLSSHKRAWPNANHQTRATLTAHKPSVGGLKLSCLDSVHVFVQKQVPWTTPGLQRECKIHLVNLGKLFLPCTWTTVACLSLGLDCLKAAGGK